MGSVANIDAWRSDSARRLGLAPLWVFVSIASCSGQRTPLQLNLAVSADQLDEVGTLPTVELSLRVGERAPEVFRFRGRDRRFTPPSFAFGTPIDVIALGKNDNGDTLYRAEARGIAATEGTPLVVSLLLRRGNDFARTLGPPNASRRFHTATRLQDGRVLLVGGEDANGRALASAELYDPASARFTPTAGTLTLARARHAAVLLRDGRVLLAGGRDGQTFHTTIEAFEPTTSAFTAAGALSIERAELTATRYLVAEVEKVLFAGGTNARGPQLNADVYIPATGTIAAPRTMNATRAGHAATEVAGGVLLLGGSDSPFGDVYSFVQERFTATSARMEAARARTTALTRADGSVLVGGSTDSIELIEPGQSRITVWSRLDAARSDLTLASLSDNAPFVNTALVNTVLVAGGAVQAGPLTAAFTSENGAPNATVRPLDVARQGHTATSLQDGTVLIVGGAREPSAEVYAPAF